MFKFNFASVITLESMRPYYSRKRSEQRRLTKDLLYSLLTESRTSCCQRSLNCSISLPLLRLRASKGIMLC